MAVTYRRRKQAVPYKTRLTGRLMFLSESVFERSEENASYQRMGGSAQHAGPLANSGNRHSGACQRVRAKRGPMTGSDEPGILGFPDVQLHICGPREDARPGNDREIVYACSAMTLSSSAISASGAVTFGE